jgi:hypothetical protein
MIDRVTATGFHHFLETGRTRPGLFYCESPSTEVADYVVKLRGGMERPNGAVCELYAAMLAAHFGLSAPAPSIVLIEEDLARAIAEAEPDTKLAAIIKNSVGLNFGSRFLSNVAPWPEGQGIPGALVDDAMKVYSFDALIQNPDRRFDNPNLGTRGGKIVVFDHESAFSFLLSIFPSKEPWRLAAESYLDNHVFATRLKGEAFCDDFTQRLSSLTGEALQFISSQFPVDWPLQDLPKMEAHLELVRQHSAEFADEVLRRLG